MAFSVPNRFLASTVPNRKSVAYLPIDWVGSHGGFSQKHPIRLDSLGTVSQVDLLNLPTKTEQSSGH